MKIELDSNPIYDAMLYEALLDMESITEEMLECMDLVFNLAAASLAEASSNISISKSMHSNISSVILSISNKASYRIASYIGLESNSIFIHSISSLSSIISSSYYTTIKFSNSCKIIYLTR